MPDDDPREASADVSRRTCGTKEKGGKITLCSSLSGGANRLRDYHLHATSQGYVIKKG